ncbi:Putative periplasmic protein [Helicobacter mustelae 12198]|uniref:Putative periplasmic protein n=1 Tax=Helicobacter mustelae (strain ATCC 43772 / CCUG 25715 / CIP 103759 / LMG 18044 / NCTC 12198 / R85-136P) TaxID=679897 RepID=D3UFX8_HELM1|nr:Putative periplasmic protein [Helicobacter mustelae 12198]
MKYYLGFTIVFVLGISVYVYSVLPGNFTLAMPTNEKVELPVAIWVAIILSLFFVMSLLFFFWDFLRTKFLSFYYLRDFSALMDQFLNQSMGKPVSPTQYRQQNLGTISRVLSRFELRPRLDSKSSGVEKIDRVFDVLEQISLGYEQDIKKYNLPYENDFFIKNIMNKLKKDYRFGINAFKMPIPNGAKKEVFLQILERIEPKDLYKILELEKVETLDKEMSFAIVEFLQKKGKKVEDDYLMQIFKKSKFDAEDYLKLAKRTKHFYTPDEWLKFFEDLCTADERAENSYLYVLCDLEMLDLARQKLSSLPKNEFLNVRAYLDLRSHGGNYPLSIFFENIT